jgi:phospholipase C
MKLLVVIATIFCAFKSTDGAASSRIKHIIVLMMENRSFDHLLGTFVVVIVLIGFKIFFRMVES